MAGTSAGATISGGRKVKDPFLDLVYIEEVNKRNNKDFALFENFQINPYTKKTLDFTTPKITDRPPKVPACCIDGYERIREFYYKPICTPLQKYNHPQTEAQQHGFFPTGTGYFDKENYDDRFKFSHKTAEFIKTQAMIKAYDKLMSGLSAPFGNTVKK